MGILEIETGCEHARLESGHLRIGLDLVSMSLLIACQYGQCNSWSKFLVTRDLIDIDKDGIADKS